MLYSSEAITEFPALLCLSVLEGIILSAFHNPAMLHSLALAPLTQIKSLIFERQIQTLHFFSCGKVSYFYLNEVSPFCTADYFIRSPLPLCHHLHLVSLRPFCSTFVFCITFLPPAFRFYSLPWLSSVSPSLRFMSSANAGLFRLNLLLLVLPPYHLLPLNSFAQKLVPSLS